MPYEYCEFSASKDACKANMKQDSELADMFAQLYGPEDPASGDALSDSAPVKKVLLPI